MAISMEQVKKLREQTGAGVVDVKKALDEANGDTEKAREILKKKGQDKALKKNDREASEGVIGNYIHSNKKVGVMVKLLCETDFVAKNEEFQELSRDIAMHIAAMNPECLRPEEIPGEVIEKEREIWKEQLAGEGKSEEILTNILQGKEKKFREERALLTQVFVKNPDITIEQLVTEKIAKVGEKIQIGEFVRYEL
jgi:elongation factor Ts